MTGVPGGAAVAVRDPLTTKEGWRRFVEDVPAPPALLHDTWRQPDAPTRSAYDQERLDHHARLVVVTTPTIRQVTHTGRRHHERLVRRFGIKAAQAAYEHAEHVVMDWHDWGWHWPLQQRWDQRMSRLGASELARDSASLDISIYPEVVTLADLVAERPWRSNIDGNNRRTWDAPCGRSKAPVRSLALRHQHRKPTHQVGPR